MSPWIDYTWHDTWWKMHERWVQAQALHSKWRNGIIDPKASRKQAGRRHLNLNSTSTRDLNSNSTSKQRSGNNHYRREEKSSKQRHWLCSGSLWSWSEVNYLPRIFYFVYVTLTDLPWPQMLQEGQIPGWIATGFLQFALASLPVNISVGCCLQTFQRIRRFLRFQVI